MKNIKLLMLAVIIYSLFLAAEVPVFAATLPFSNVALLAKSVASKHVLVGTTDSNGNFNINVPEENGAFDVYMNDESLPAIRIMAKNGLVSGRIVVLTDGTTTQDPAPAKKAVKVAKAKPATKTKKSKSN